MRIISHFRIIHLLVWLIEFCILIYWKWLGTDRHFVPEVKGGSMPLILCLLSFVINTLKIGYKKVRSFHILHQIFQDLKKMLIKLLSDSA